MAGERKKVLVVDDDPNVLKAMALALHHEGYAVVTASRGEEALSTIRQEEPGLVLLDIIMPGMGGLAVLKGIKKINKDIPVTMVTALCDAKEAKSCLDAGAYDYIAKPIDVETFITEIQKYL